jgi:hypothetical protein
MVTMQNYNTRTTVYVTEILCIDRALKFGTIKFYFGLTPLNVDLIIVLYSVITAEPLREQRDMLKGVCHPLIPTHTRTYIHTRSGHSIVKQQ